VEFWLLREHTFSRLAQLAEDIFSAPASEDYCEIVLVCGDVIIENCNCMSVGLERRVFMKLNVGVGLLKSRPTEAQCGFEPTDEFGKVAVHTGPSPYSL